MIMAASPRHSGHKTTAHSNNNGRSNNRSPDPPVLPTIESMPESSEYGKKHKSNITLRRLWTKFHLLSRPLQIIAIGFISIVIGLVAMSTFNLLISSSKQQPNSSKLHTFVASAKQGGETIIKGAKEDGKQPPHHVINLPQNTDKAAMAKMKNRPQISGASKRVVELMDGDVTNVADKESEDGKVPKFGVHELVERYNPMPHEMPALKGASTMDKGQCQAIADWQKGHDPTCNIIHEMTWGWDHLYGDKENLHHLTDDDEEARLKAGGAFRHVWMIREFDGTKRALKTLRASKAKDFDLRNFDRHRRDAVAFEQLTASPLIVDMYGYCTQSALFDWGEGGDLLSIFEREPHISNEKLLKIAYNASSAIADAHHPDEHGRPTMAHTDIKPDQFLYQDGYYRLTDFNRVRFLMWNDEKGTSLFMLLLLFWGLAY